MHRPGRSFQQMSVAEYRRYFTDRSRIPQRPRVNNAKSYKPFHLSDVICEPSHQASDNEDCCVCFSPTQSRTVCSHPLCTECLNKLLQSVPAQCPLCRRHLSQRNRMSSDVSLAELVVQVRTATLADLVSVASHATRCTAVATDEAARMQLVCAFTSRVIELLPGLSLRGLGLHINTLRKIKIAGYLHVASDDNEHDTDAGIPNAASAIEHTLLECFRDRLRVPTRGCEHGLSMQALRPLVNIFTSFRDAGLVREASATSWFTSQVLHQLEVHRMGKTYVPLLKVAHEFASKGAIDRNELERVTCRHWESFIHKEGSTWRPKDIAFLRTQVLECSNVHGYAP